MADLDLDIISFVDLGSSRMGELAEMVTDLSVSYTMDEASQVTISVLDPDFKMLRNNYFQIRRNILYRGDLFEIAATDVGTAGSTPLITVEARPAAVQAMKRDKKPEAYRGVSATEYARVVASRFGLKLFGENTTKKQNIIKSQNANSDESVWDVLKRSAGDAQFVCFVSGDTLFFCSQKFLLGRIGADTGALGVKSTPMTWPTPESEKRFFVMNQPRVRRSDDDPLEGDGSLIVDRDNGVKLRAGQTIFLKGVPSFNGLYLITSVSFNEAVPDPVDISFRTPEKPKPENNQ